MHTTLLNKTTNTWSNNTNKHTDTHNNSNAHIRNNTNKHQEQLIKTCHTHAHTQPHTHSNAHKTHGKPETLRNRYVWLRVVSASRLRNDCVTIQIIQQHRLVPRHSSYFCIVAQRLRTSCVMVVNRYRTVTEPLRSLSKFECEHTVARVVVFVCVVLAQDWTTINKTQTANTHT